MNFVTKSIKNRDSAQASAAAAKLDSPKGQAEESIMFGLFDNYLTCNLNIAEEIEAWVEETKRFQDSVHCS